MHGIALLLAAASVGVDYGWQPDADGVMEYIIQVEPELISALQKGEAIISEIHPDARGVRRFRIQIGTAPLPRISPPAAPVTALPEEFTPAEKPASAVSPAQPPSRPTDNSSFRLEESPPAPEKSSASDFPLLPPPANPPASLAEPPASSEDRESSFPLTATELSPETPSPQQAIAATGKSAPLQRPIPVPDPDRLPLEPAALPVADKETTRQAISISDPTQPPARLASFDQQNDSNHSGETNKRQGDDAESSHASRPWLLFSVTIIALLGSLGANAYLGYLFFGLQQRYQGLRRDRQSPQAS